MLRLLKLAKRTALLPFSTAKNSWTELLTRRTFQSAAQRLEIHEFRRRVLGFIDSMSCPNVHIAAYRYSTNTAAPTLYSSAYAAMTYSLLGHLQTLPEATRREWIAYFNDHQDARNGLFDDAAVSSPAFRDSDWWGGRHLALHMITAYTALGGRPQHQFRFLEEYYDPARIIDWLDDFDWDQPFPYTVDIDNKIMNIACLLQYQRDYWHDARAAQSVSIIQQYLMERIDPTTGMWGRFDTEDPQERSRMVQFAYHLLPMFFYDSILTEHQVRIVPHVLRTQSGLGGFGVRANSSACEDIDSVDLLIRCGSLTPHLKPDIDHALTKAMGWISANQMQDGGFVFRQHEPFTYGHKEMHSGSNVGSMFSTWFRTLSIAYIARYKGLGGFHLVRAPGLEF